MVYAGPLLIAIGTAFLCIIALAGTSGNIKTRTFRIGLLLLVPLVILWAVLSGASCAESECGELWRTLPLYGALVGAALWHAALIELEEPRRFYVAYAVHLPIFYWTWGLAVALATNFPL
jgi:hypothetical protein